MSFDYEYKHLKYDLVNNLDDLQDFDKVKNLANQHELLLSNSDFKSLLRLEKSGKDVDWIMNGMSKYKQSLAEMLVAMLTYY